MTSPAFIVMKAADAFANPTTAINQLWQTDFTYIKVTGWGWFYCRPCSMTLPLHRRLEALHHDERCRRHRNARAGLAGVRVDHADLPQRPRLLSDNGPSYVASELAEWLEDQGMRHTRGKPYHPMTRAR